MFIWYKILTVIILTGKLTFYNSGIMEEVYTNRIAYQHVTPCVECIGMIAVLDCQYLNKLAWLKVNNKLLGPLLIVDCAAQHDYKRLLQRGLVAEIDYMNAMKLNMNGPLAVTVYIYERRILYDY